MSDKSNSVLLEEAIKAFNYPEEMGDKVDESVVQINEILEQVEKGTPEEKIISWLSKELTSHIAAEIGAGEATPYSEVRLASKPGEPAVIEAYHFQKETWEKIKP